MNIAPWTFYVRDVFKNWRNGTCFGIVFIYVWLETRWTINGNHDCEHVFWRRTSVRLARSPFKNHSKTCVLARVLALYLYTFGSKPVQKSTKNVCFGTCFGNLRANEEIEHMNIAPWTFYVCDVFQNLRKSSFDFFRGQKWVFWARFWRVDLIPLDFFVARNGSSEHGVGAGFGAFI